MKIIAIIMDGRHGGQKFVTEYYPTVKLPIKENQISIGEAEDIKNGELTLDYEVYYECFMAVDKQTVLYSTTGRSDNLMAFRPTYPVPLF